MYDLGCGDGRIICAAAGAGARARGFEISLLPYFIAKIRRLFQNNKSNIKISYKNIWNLDLSDADIVYFFLMEEVHPRLKQKFEKELKKGAKIISYAWPIKGWEASMISVVDNRPKIYLYQR